MANFRLSIVAPDRTVFDDEVKSVIIPAYGGYMGIMASHEPSIVALRPGFIEYTSTNDLREFITVSGGFAEASDGKVIVLAKDAALAHEVSLAEAEASMEEARKALRGESSTMSSDEATEEIERAMVRIRAAKR